MKTAEINKSIVYLQGKGSVPESAGEILEMSILSNRNCEMHCWIIFIMIWQCSFQAQYLIDTAGRRRLHHSDEIDMINSFKKINFGVVLEPLLQVSRRFEHYVALFHSTDAALPAIWRLIEINWIAKCGLQ